MKMITSPSSRRPGVELILLIAWSSGFQDRVSDPLLLPLLLFCLFFNLPQKTEDLGSRFLCLYPPRALTLSKGTHGDRQWFMGIEVEEGKRRH